MQSAIDKIRELRALHEDGLLSRQEFDLRKNAILDASYPAQVRDVGGDASAARPGTEIGLMAGQELGPPDRRYRLGRLIAHGGMGQVWEATDLATEAELGHSAQVALKILSPQLTQSPHHARLLVEEAARARRLAHEHIVRVYDWAQDPATGSYFIIMECLDGEDLANLLAREGRLPLQRAVALLAPVAAALDYAWDRHRLVHRDIKPGNLFVTKDGEAKLLDFGIAVRVRASGDARVEAPADSGTAGYRAPEAHVPDLAPDRRLDVYAVAVLLYQMVEGSLPFGDARPASLDGPAWEVLRRGFAHDPATRPLSVTDLLDRLRRAAAPAGPASPQAVVKEVIPTIALAGRQRRENEQGMRMAAEEERLARRETLRQQLIARRAQDAETARLAQRQAAQPNRATNSVAPTQSPAPASHMQPARLRDSFVGDNGEGPELLALPAGRFLMGSPDSERATALEAGARKAWLAREAPQHWVDIAKPFAMGRCPVTVGQWREFALATRWKGSGSVNWAAPGFTQTDDHPVVGTSWLDAQLYLRWLSARTGKAYRLPTEAEWEYACRAGTATAFNCGDSIGPGQANFDARFSYNGSPLGGSRRGTTQAGSYPPNGWGLCDMHGNVWEWVQDVVHDSYEGAPLDGSAWEEGGDQGRRILRGGSWLYHPRYLRSAMRNGFSARLSNDKVGFRVVRELP